MKLKKLRQLMAEKGFDGLLISSPINQSYISGADFHDGFLAVTSDECAACVDFRYYEAVKGSVSEGIDTKLAESSTLNCALDLLTASGAKSIAFEGGVSYSVYRKISEKLSPTVTLSAEAGGLLNAMRAVKTEAELEKIAEAQKITDLAFSHVLSFMSPNMTERELALELEYFMRKSGADAMAFDVIAVSGGASALPHGVPRDVRLERGFLTMDFGAQKAGYCSDMTRTVVIGKADAEMKRLYDTVLLAQRSALDALCEGLACSKADAIARDIINGAGYEGCFGHSLGHGVGRYIHEEPRLSTRSEDTLTVGNVVTVEPGIYIEGKYGCRIEDMVAITKDGIHNFTKSKKELIELF